MMHYWWYHKSIGLENWTMIIIFSYCFKKLTHPSNLRCSAFLLLLLCFCYCTQRKLDKPCEKTDRKEIHILLLFAPFQKLWFTLMMFQIHRKKVSFSNNASETSYVSFQSISHQKSFKKSTIDFWYFWYENHIRISFRFRCTFVLTNLDNHCLK